MPKAFLEGPELTSLVARARELKDSGKKFSDVVDENGYQYVDLVQEGGGVLGIALIGYTYILEQAGIRFYNLAGTSVGAIHTLLMAGMAKIGETTSEKVLKAISNKNLLDFMDGPRGIKKLIQYSVEGKKGLIWRLLWNSCKIYFLLKNELGLNPGVSLEKWLNELLSSSGIKTYADLKKHRNTLPKLINLQDTTKEVPPPKMAIITADVTTHTKTELPKMASLYWNNSEEICPSQFVRTSLSIPIFYYPYRLKNIPNAGAIKENNWVKYAGYRGVVPKEIKFVDGGLLSNFPINIFHKEEMPTRPTFGARLSTYRKSYSNTSTFFSFGWAIISTMRHIHDYDFVHRNPDYQKLICNIDADQEFNWLDFNMSQEKQKRLFMLGVEKGLEFLEKFDWEAYKRVRAKK